MAGVDMRAQTRALLFHLARALAVLLLIGMVVFVWIGAAASRAPAHPGRAAATVTAVSQKAGFRPATVTVTRGGSVTWRNADAMPHNVVSQGGGGISSPVLQAGQSYSRVFRRAGTFPYVCAMHPEMHGTVIVR